LRSRQPVIEADGGGGDCTAQVGRNHDGGAGDAGKSGGIGGACVPRLRRRGGLLLKEDAQILRLFGV
jgi:hypothetical protein